MTTFASPVCQVKMLETPEVPEARGLSPQAANVSHKCHLIHTPG